MAEIEQKYRQQMQELARQLDMYFNGEDTPKTVGFALFVFPFGAPENARTNYISNAVRSDMIVAMKEVLARFEGQAEVKGNA